MANLSPLDFNLSKWSDSTGVKLPRLSDLKSGTFSFRTIQSWLPLLGLATLLTAGLAASLILISSPQDLRQQASTGLSVYKPDLPNDGGPITPPSNPNGVTCAGGIAVGQKACAGFRSIVTCESTGLFSAASDCDPNQICQNGQCVARPPQSCYGGVADGSTACASNREVVTCRGGYFVEPTRCPDGQSCQSGRCTGTAPAPVKTQQGPKPDSSSDPAPTTSQTQATIRLPQNLANGQVCTSNTQCQSGHCILQPNLRAKFCQSEPTPENLPATAGITCYEVVNGDCRMRFYAGTTSCAVGTATKLAECQTECQSNCQNLGLSAEACRTQCLRPEVGVSGPATVVCYNAAGSSLTRLKSQGCPLSHPSINAPAAAKGSCTGTASVCTEANTVFSCVKGVWAPTGTCSHNLRTINITQGPGGSSRPGTTTTPAKSSLIALNSLLDDAGKPTNTTGTDTTTPVIEPSTQLERLNICQTSCQTLGDETLVQNCLTACQQNQNSACDPSRFSVMTEACSNIGEIPECQYLNNGNVSEPIVACQPEVYQNNVLQDGCSRIGDCVPNEFGTLVRCEIESVYDPNSNNVVTYLGAGDLTCPLTLQNENGCTQVGQCVGNNNGGITQCERATYTDEFSGASGSYLRAGSVSCNITQVQNIGNCSRLNECVRHNGQFVRCDRTLQETGMPAGELREVFFAGNRACSITDAAGSTALSVVQLFGIFTNLNEQP